MMRERRSVKIDATWRKIASAAVGVVCVVAAWQFSKWGLANSAAYRAGDVDVAQYLTGMAPSDPQTHYAAAVFLEKSFDPVDIQKALTELETAVALSPNNYLLWLDLGRARERSGDAEGAERALRRSLELAPNYSRVQWALGNALLRQGRTEEAFAEIRKAVIADPTFAGPAASAAWQFFDGDIAKIRNAMAGSKRFAAALAGLLAREKRFEEALAHWDELSADEKRTTFKDAGVTLTEGLLAAKRFRDAQRITAETGTGAIALAVGTVTNGGFESAVKIDGAGTFDWQIAPGLQPQIVLSGGQKHGGNNSLYLIFNSNDAKDFRPIAQTVAVEPGAAYELEVFYRSEIKSSAEFKWEVADADGKRIAVGPPIALQSDWTSIRVPFAVPPMTDSVTIRFVREGCGQVCTVTGNLWFDDISLKRIQT